MIIWLALAIMKMIPNIWFLHQCKNLKDKEFFYPMCYAFNFIALHELYSTMKWWTLLTLVFLVPLLHDMSRDLLYYNYLHYYDIIILKCNIDG